MTLKDVAALSGTSISTVSRVISDHPKISKETKERVMKVVRKVGFELNPAARALAGGRTGMVGVLASNISSGFFAEVIHGIDDMTRWKQGHILCSFASDPDDYIRMLNRITSHGQVDGVIIVAPPIEIFSQPFLFNVPLVSCASAPPESSLWRNCDSITFDNRSTMMDLVHHLADSGCQSILHVAGPKDNFDAVERMRAFQSATQSRGAVKSDIIHTSWGPDEISDAAKHVLLESDELPDGIIAWNDSTAVGFLKVLAQREDLTKKVRITGWDDNPMDEVLGLTSVRMPMREMGEHAARLLYERLGDPQRKEPTHDEFGLDLIVRASSS